VKFFGFELKRVKKGERYYEAADKGRRGKSFRLARATGPNAEISQALADLRARSRLMCRNNGWGKRAVECVVKNTIGEGIRPAPLGKTLEENQLVKSVWRRWAESTACDWYGKTNLYGLQEQAMRSIVEGGDIIVIMRRVAGEIPLKLQLCEGDIIDHTRNGKNDFGMARMGVQFTEEGELKGYWLWNYHPGDGYIYGMDRQSEFYDKRDILHIFEVLRIGQVRGVPFGVPAFMKLSDFGDYEDSQLVKQKIATNYVAFVSSDSVDKSDFHKDWKNDDCLEPGAIERLAMGETITFAEPPSVGDYDVYSTRILQGIAAAYGITYEMLTMDYSRVNFTSGRMAKIDVTQNFRSWQYNMMTVQFCAPVWEWFMDACMISGALPNRVDTDWTAPRVQQLDPVKETNALISQRAAGLTTLSEIIRENGRDPQELFEEMKQENDMLEELGIVLNPFVATPKEVIGKEGNDSKDFNGNKGFVTVKNLKTIIN